MGRNYKLGDVIKGTSTSFEIIEKLNRGAMAIAYSAKDVNTGEKVFLKKYLSPTVAVEWYPKYVAYQKEMKRRIERTDLKIRTLQIIDFFEAHHPKSTLKKMSFHQVFEFVDDGSDLSKKLENNPSWSQRVVDAKVLLKLLIDLHAEKVVHTDLKPQNIQIQSGVMKLIDMDFSVLSDQKPPWDGFTGYVGTPGYMSPEHLGHNGVKVPNEASDTFTAGLILYEILTGTHPYISEEDYKDAVVNWKAPRPRFLGDFENENDEEIALMLRKMLHPDISSRASLQDMRSALFEKKRRRAVPPPPRTETTPRETTPRETTSITPPEPESGTNEITLMFGDENVVLAVSRRRLNKDWAKTYFGDECRFWANDSQMDLEKKSDGWYITPNPSAPNDTMLNGKKITTSTKLNEGDQIGVGRESKNIVKTPFTIKYGSHEKRRETTPEPSHESISPISLQFEHDLLELNTSRRKLNKDWAKTYFGDERRFWANDSQMDLEKKSDGWYITPNPSAPNDTMLNGKKITTSTKLNEGDQIGVGRESKNIVKTPFTVKF